jgi:hypothetical protein
MSDWQLDTLFGFALSPSGDVLAESAWGEEQLLASGLLRGRRVPRPRSLAGAHASLISQWCEHYYHWLADALPRFLVLEKLGLADAPMLVPRDLPSYQRDSLVLLCASADRLVPAAADLVQPDTLVWPAFEDHRDTRRSGPVGRLAIACATRQGRGAEEHGASSSAGVVPRIGAWSTRMNGSTHCTSKNSKSSRRSC